MKRYTIEAAIPSDGGPERCTTISYSVEDFVAERLFPVDSAHPDEGGGLVDIEIHGDHGDFEDLPELVRDLLEADMYDHARAVDEAEADEWADHQRDAKLETRP